MPLGGDYEPLFPPPTTTGNVQQTAFQPGQGPGVQANAAPAPASNPMYGQGADSPNYGQGYNPDSGLTYDQYKANRRAYKQTFQPGGWRFERNQDEEAKIAAAHPTTWAGVEQLLASMGIHNAKDQRMHRYNEIKSWWDGPQNIGNYHVAGNVKFNTGTSDQNAGWEPVTAADYADMNTSFYDRINANLGLGSIQRWAKQGKTGYVKGADGRYTNTSPDGQVTYLNPKTGVITDASGRPVGYYGRPRF